MKNSVLALAVLMITGVIPARADDQIILSTQDKEVIAQELINESKGYDEKTNKLILRMSDEFKASVLNESGDKCKNCVNSEKKLSLITKVGRKLGKASAWLTTTTGKPVINAAGFLTGLFEKKEKDKEKEEKNKKEIAFYKFFLNHEDEFDGLEYKGMDLKVLTEAIAERVEAIMEKKSRIIMRDFLDSLELKKEIPEDLSTFSLTDEEIAKIDPQKLSPAFINNHKEFQEVKPLIGDVTSENIRDILTSGYFDQSLSIPLNTEALPKIHEAFIMVVGQVFAPKIVLGIISSTLANLYATPVFISQVGTAVSAGICLQPKTIEKFKSDDDLETFCTYVVSRSSYELTKSRTKGYVAGKSTRNKIEQKLADRKARREAKREAKKIELK